ncbi:MAG: PorP/SprF family type IX secretion system membrane protein [Bacteroidia bacterium]|nr:PorP/SprF family type IX secretion system membrane protein [Bacteroidia bacterium]
MKSKIKIFVLISVLTANLLFAQQQSIYTSILTNPVYYNPSWISVNKEINFNGIYRYQWAGFTGAPKNFNASVYGTFKKKYKNAVGVLLGNDQAGLLSRTNIYGMYAYQLPINKTWSAYLGLQFGFVQYSLRAFDANPYDKDDIFLTSNILNANTYDAGFGTYLTNQKFFFSLSFQQLTRSRIYWHNKQGRLTPHNYVFFGYNFVLDKKKNEYELQPSVFFRFNSPAPFQAEYNLKLTYKKFLWIAGTFRHAKTITNFKEPWKTNSVCFLAGANVKNVTVAYSFDFGLNNIRNYQTGTHEVYLSYRIPRKINTVNKIQTADEEEFNTLDNSIKTNLKNKKKE